MRADGPKQLLAGPEVEPGLGSRISSSTGPPSVRDAAPRGSLRVRLTASHLLVACFALALVVAWLPPAVERTQVAIIQRHLVDEARLLRRLIAPLLAGSHSSAVSREPEIQLLARQVGEEIHARVTVLDARGKVLSDTATDASRMENHADRPEVREAVRTGLGRSRRASRTLGTDQLYVAVSVPAPSARAERESAEQPLVPAPVLGVVRLSQTLGEVRDDVQGLRQALLGGLFAAVVAAFGLSLLMTRSVTRPLGRLRDVALELGHGDLSRRALLASRDEIGELARAFNGMATRLEETIAQLGRDRSQMRTVFDTMSDGLLVTEMQGRVRLLNPAAAALLGVDAGTAAGKTVLDVTLDAPLQSLVDQVLRTGIPGAQERVLRTPAERVVAVSAVPLRPAGGDHDSARGQEGAVLVFHDLTTLRQVERMRRDFVANASHELRTPLASMRVMVETLLHGAREDPEAAQRFLQILDRELLRMTNLVNDLLVLSRLDAPVEAMSLERVNLQSVVEELEDGWEAVACERGLRLLVEIPPRLSVLGEKGGIRQILANLVDNALKYTPAGEVRVVARREGERCVLEVRDSGIGIPAADLDRIFERFYRVDKDRSRDVGGTGLGLSIVKHLVQAYGGSVSVRSSLNRGSTFRVTLPVGEGETVD